jgi:hypothetical protein
LAKVLGVDAEAVDIGPQGREQKVEGGRRSVNGDVAMNANASAPVIQYPASSSNAKCVLPVAFSSALVTHP